MAKQVTPARPKRGRGRRALLEAVITVVGRRGLRGLTYRAVAEAAGVTHGLVAHHFGSRDALISEALRHATTQSIEDSSIRAGTGRLEEFAAGLAALVERDKDLQIFQYELLLEAHRRPEYAGHAREIYRQYIDAVAQELNDLGLGGDDDLARVIFATLDGLVLQQLIFDKPALTTTAIERLRKTLHQIGAVDKPSTGGTPATGQHAS